ncbi:Fic family protein (plasmid) [Rhizobium sp. 32-5/1]|uniref:Fic family protein n=1 Tax=Rhizobium sp. 32-5/1 TaxID=3019602 RepID=UPI00240D365B|nr:Fic family protein [Rhizobium sp. 32-5/1]WEZ85931.1 Fic family protein [Rhizobium sp. 32-5/1]
MDLVSQDELDEFELAMFLTRVEEAWPTGKLDYAHYLAIHRHLFQDVYSWAGEARSVRIGSGGNWFCYPEYIDGEMTRIFKELEAAHYLTGLEPAAFATAAADGVRSIVNLEMAGDVTQFWIMAYYRTMA